MEHQPSSAELRAQEQEKRIAKEMMPYFVYMAIPLIITIIIALVFAPNMTLP